MNKIPENVAIYLHVWTSNKGANGGSGGGVAAETDLALFRPQFHHDARFPIHANYVTVVHLGE